MSRFRIGCYNWICGTTETPKKTLTEAEKQEMRRKLTSLEQSPTARKFLNAGAIAVATFTVFLIGFFY